MANFYIYLIIINILTFVIFCIDKKRARHHSHRFRTNTLIALAIMGGSIGALLAMYSARHKTQNPKFVFGIPYILVAHIILFVMILR